MSINLEEDMNPEFQERIKELFPVEAMDNRTVLIGNMEKAFKATEMKLLANIAKQPVALELNEIGDRKDVGGIIYELEEAGWKKMPIGSTLEKNNEE